MPFLYAVSIGPICTSGMAVGLVVHFQIDVRALVEQGAMAARSSRPEAAAMSGVCGSRFDVCGGVGVGALRQYFTHRGDIPRPRGNHEDFLRFERIVFCETGFFRFASERERRHASHETFCQGAGESARAETGNALQTLFQLVAIFGRMPTEANGRTAAGGLCEDLEQRAAVGGGPFESRWGCSIHRRPAHGRVRVTGGSRATRRD